MKNAQVELNNREKDDLLESLNIIENSEITTVISDVLATRMYELNNLSNEIENLNNELDKSKV